LRPFAALRSGFVVATGAPPAAWAPDDADVPALGPAGAFASGDPLPTVVVAPLEAPLFWATLCLLTALLGLRSGLALFFAKPLTTLFDCALPCFEALFLVFVERG